MMKRKTVDVEYMKAFANGMMASTNPLGKEVRLGVSYMLEEMLHRTGNYKGFKFLDQKVLDNQPDGDETQRMYF